MPTVSGVGANCSHRSASEPVYPTGSFRGVLVNANPKKELGDLFQYDFYGGRDQKSGSSKLFSTITTTLLRPLTPLKNIAVGSFKAINHAAKGAFRGMTVRFYGNPLEAKYEAQSKYEVQIKAVDHVRLEFKTEHDNGWVPFSELNENHKDILGVDALRAYTDINHLLSFKDPFKERTIVPLDVLKYQLAEERKRLISDGI